MILEAFELYGRDKCFPGLVKAYYEKGEMPESFETAIQRLLQAQRIVIMPDGDYQINDPVSP